MKRLATLLAGAAFLALAACTSGGPKTEAGGGVALYALDCGRFTLADAGAFADDRAYDGQTKTLVDPCYLIRHHKGDLLWDTGIPEAIADMPNGFSEDGMSATFAKKLTAQLGELGLSPADIEFVSISHAHFDHVGNANLFAPTATFILDKDERAYMFRPEARADARSFAMYDKVEAATTTLIEGDADFDVFGDGSVKIVQAPGHTPGHAVLLVTLASGPVLLTGDLWHIAESRAARRVPVFNTDRAQTLASMDKVEALAAATKARVVRQHVAEDFEALPKFPEALR
jgi:N-acyl homoserine lactone hydrolase